MGNFVVRTQERSLVKTIGPAHVGRGCPWDGTGQFFGRWNLRSNSSRKPSRKPEQIKKTRRFLKYTQNLKGILPTSDGPFQGCYIDNLFTTGVDPDIVNRVQKLMTDEFEAHGLLMSEDDPARSERKLLEVMLCGERNEVRPPAQFWKEVAYIAGSTRLKVWEFDKIMGKCV